MPFQNSDRTQPEGAAAVGETSARRLSPENPYITRQTAKAPARSSSTPTAPAFVVATQSPAGQDDVKREDLADYLRNGETIIGRALIIMRTVGGPERLAPDYPAQQRHVASAR